MGNNPRTCTPRVYVEEISVLKPDFLICDVSLQLRSLARTRLPVWAHTAQGCDLLLRSTKTFSYRTHEVFMLMLEWSSQLRP